MTWINPDWLENLIYIAMTLAILWVVDKRSKDKERKRRERACRDRQVREDKP